ncbi:hypothetical protein EDB80DRAFT_693390 [Ilyonectria destructans]|nr:hypothetical protein EDB80DRAFT_693390 [Ilyonectria destructans]
MPKNGYMKIGGSQRLHRQRSATSGRTKQFVKKWKKILTRPSTEAKIGLQSRSMENLELIVKSDEVGGLENELSPHWNSASNKTAKRPPYIVFTHAHACHENGEDDDLRCGWWSDGEEVDNGGEARGASIT